MGENETPKESCSKDKGVELMKKSTDFNPEIKAYEFYISSSSKDLMNHISEIMRRNGYIGYADGGGKMHYIVDGSKNLYKTSNSIMQILSDGEAAAYQADNHNKLKLQEKAVQQVLEKYKFQRHLKGFNYLKLLLETVLASNDNKTIPDKEVYSIVCKAFETGRRQLDRVLNYTFKKVNLHGTNTTIITELIREVEEEYKQLQLEEIRQ